MSSGPLRSSMLGVTFGATVHIFTKTSQVSHFVCHWRPSREARSPAGEWRRGKRLRRLSPIMSRVFGRWRGQFKLTVHSSQFTALEGKAGGLHVGDDEAQTPSRFRKTMTKNSSTTRHEPHHVSAPDGAHIFPCCSP